METTLANINNENVDLLQVRLNPTRFPRLSQVSREFAVERLSQIVFQALMYKGQTAEPNNISFIANNLYDEVMTAPMDARELTIEEIHRAIKKAVLTDEKMYGVNVSSLFKVIMGYIKKEGAAIANKVYEMKKQQDTNPALKIMQDVYAARMLNK